MPWLLQIIVIPVVLFFILTPLYDLFLKERILRTQKHANLRRHKSKVRKLSKQFEEVRRFTTSDQILIARISFDFVVLITFAALGSYIFHQSTVELNALSEQIDQGKALRNNWGYLLLILLGFGLSLYIPARLFFKLLTFLKNTIFLLLGDGIKEDIMERERELTEGRERIAELEEEIEVSEELQNDPLAKQRLVQDIKRLKKKILKESRELSELRAKLDPREKLEAKIKELENENERG